MFIEFFYKLKETGVPVSPTSFLTLHRALNQGLVTSLNDFYTSARSILVKSERYFDDSQIVGLINERQRPGHGQARRQGTAFEFLEFTLERGRRRKGREAE